MPTDGQLKVYLAGPFFSPDQLEFITQLESVIMGAGCILFSPRLEPNAVEMNDMIRGGQTPSLDLRCAVFDDNTNNIDDSDLVVAVVDDFDSGTMFEFGYAFRAHVPIVSVTQHDYGCNLMLAHSIIAHVKSLSALREVLDMAAGLSSDADAEAYGRCITMIQRKYLSFTALREGPEERAR